MLIFSRFKARETGDGAVRALPQALDSHGLANKDPKCLHNVPMHDKKCIFGIFMRKKENGSGHKTPHGRRYPFQQFFSSFKKAQGKVPRLEIKNQTYEKLRQRHKKSKAFQVPRSSVWLLPPTPRLP